MAKSERHIIARYEIPVIGKYEIDEGMTVLLNDKEFGYSTSIEDAKDKIRSSVAEQMKVQTEQLQTRINALNSINVGLIDEKYRKKAFNN